MWGDCNGASMKQVVRLMDAGEGAGGMWGDCNGASMDAGGCGLGSCYSALPSCPCPHYDSQPRDFSPHTPLLSAAHGGQVVCDAALATSVLADWEAGWGPCNDTPSSYDNVASSPDPRPGSIRLRDPSTSAEPSLSQARIDSSGGSSVGVTMSATTSRSLASERHRGHSTARLALATYREEDDEEPLSCRHARPDLKPDPPSPGDPISPLAPGAASFQPEVAADGGARADSWFGAGTSDGQGSDHGLDNQPHAAASASALDPEAPGGAGAATEPVADSLPLPTAGGLQAGVSGAVGDVVAVHAGVFRYEQGLGTQCCLFSLPGEFRTPFRPLGTRMIPSAACDSSKGLNAVVTAFRSFPFRPLESCLGSAPPDLALPNACVPPPCPAAPKGPGCGYSPHMLPPLSPPRPAYVAGSRAPQRPSPSST